VYVVGRGDRGGRADSMLLVCHLLQITAFLPLYSKSMQVDAQLRATERLGWQRTNVSDRRSVVDREIVTASCNDRIE
jgi:hypothetical protein